MRADESASASSHSPKLQPSSCRPHASARNSPSIPTLRVGPRAGWLAPLLPFFVWPALDVAFQHAVLEALFFIDRFGHVVKRYDAEQGRAIDHGYVAGVPLEHAAAKLHDIEPGGGDQWIVYV